VSNRRKGPTPRKRATAVAERLIFEAERASGYFRVFINALIPPDQASALTEIAEEVQTELIPGTRLKMLMTSSFEKSVDLYERQQKVQVGNRTPYSASRSDGSMATAKTLLLESGEEIVLLSPVLFMLGIPFGRRIVLHEMQHVRIDVRGENSFGCHREGPFELPADVSWQAIWLAETMIDEFRCELELQLRGADYPGDFNRFGAIDAEGLIGALASARTAYRRSQDLIALLTDVYAVINRCSYLFAHDAAKALATDGLAAFDERWSAFTGPAASDALDQLKAFPASGMKHEPQATRDALPALGASLMRWLENFGFEHRFEADGSESFWAHNPG
jgi:hypothetical protein